MSIKKQNISRLAIGSALAFSLSACTITPASPDSLAGKATEKLASAGSSFLEKTRHVFRLDGTDAYNGKPAIASTESTDEFQNEVDLALIDQQHEDRTLVTDDGQLVILSPVADTDGVINTTPQMTEVVIEQPVVAQPAVEELVVTEVAVAEVAAEDQQPSPVAIPLADYEHTVGDSEILWDLSKRLTGDATNWRVLAELNNLGPQGTIYPGMKLVIPADMLKDRTALPVLAETVAPTDSEVSITTAEASSDRVAIPKAEAVEAVTEIIVADTAVTDGPKTGFAVQAGETMWDLAKRTTGDATNWQSIAAANGMTEKEATFVKFGETIDVPNALLKSSTPAVETVVAETETATETVLETEPPAIAAAVEAQPQQVEEIVVESAALPAAAEEELKIIPTTFKADPPVVNEVATTEETAVPAASQGKRIMVSGTYYPKAVYNDANFSASLLMRVSPGTELELIKAIGPWYEVRTEQGVGFIHSRDIK